MKSHAELVKGSQILRVQDDESMVKDDDVDMIRGDWEDSNHLIQNAPNVGFEDDSHLQCASVEQFKVADDTLPLLGHLQLPVEIVGKREIYRTNSELGEGIVTHISQPPTLLAVIIEQEDIDFNFRHQNENSTEAEKDETLLAEARLRIQKLETTQHNLRQEVNEWKENYENSERRLMRKEQIEEENLFNFRTEVANLRGKYQKEKGRVQMFQKLYVDTVPLADPHTLDIAQIQSMVNSLRYEIRNWAQKQELDPSPRPQWHSCVTRSMATYLRGSQDYNSNYEFLKDVTPEWRNYISTRGDRELILQAYVWKSVVTCVFNNNKWAVTDVDKDKSFRISAAYENLTKGLTPGSGSTDEDTVKFHEWRSRTARLIVDGMPRACQKSATHYLANLILQELLLADLPIDIDDFEGVVEVAVQLGRALAQQRTHYSFKASSANELSRRVFEPQEMTDFSGEEDNFDRRLFAKVVDLVVAPALVQHGVHQGTSINTWQLIMKPEVITKVVERVAEGY